MSRARKLLVVSLLVNILFLGIFAGHILHRFSRPEATTPELSALSPEDRAAVREGLQHAFDEGRPLRAQLHKTFAAMGHIIASEPFDEAAYDAQVAKLQTLHEQASRRMAAAIKTLARQLSQQQRAALASMLRRPPEHRSPFIHSDPPPARQPQ
jgi:uncharacterized membrane protein